MDRNTCDDVAGEGKSRAMPAPSLQAHIHSALPGTHDVIRRLNRDTTWVATGLLGTVFFAALVLALQELPQKVDGLKAEPTKTGRGLMLDANSTAVSNAVGSNEKSTDKIAAEQATSAESGLTLPINQPDTQANATSRSQPQQPDSARVIRTKVASVRLRSSVHPRYLDAKTRLIALWRQSLQREKSPEWVKFSNSNKWLRKKISYTAW
jgi:hypothetical protein